MTHTPNSSPHSRSLRPAAPLRSAALLGLGLLSLLSLSAGTVAHAGTGANPEIVASNGTVRWNGLSGDWFASPLHWVGGVAPGSGDDAENNSSAAITLGLSTTIQSFFSNGAFTLQGGTLSGSLANAVGTITVNNVFTVNGSTVSNFTVNQGTGGSVVMTNGGLSNDIINANVVVASGDLSNSIINANLDLSTYNNVYVQISKSDTLNGTTTLGTSRGLELDSSASSLVNNGTLVGFGSISQLFQLSQNIFTNNGTVNANSSANPLNLGITVFNNSGTAKATNGATLNLNSATNNTGYLVANGATLNLNSATNNTGHLVAAGGGIVNINHAFTVDGGTLDGAGGTFNVNGAALTLLGDLNTTAGTSLVFNNGNNSINAPSPVAVNTNLDLATHSDALLNINGNVTENQAISLGTTPISSGLELYNNGTTLTLSNTGSLTGFGNVSLFDTSTASTVRTAVQNGATLTAVGNISTTNSGETLINNGLINANTAGKTLGIYTAFTNTGTTEVQNGATLLVASVNVTDSGNILVKSGGTATFGHPITQTGGLTQVDGILNSSLTLSSGTLAGTGTLNGSVLNTGGTVSAGDPASTPGTVTITGVLSQASGGTLNAQFDNSKNSLFSIAGAVTTGGVLNVSYLGGATPYTGSGPFTFLNYGSLASSITGAAQPQYFLNETFDAQGDGIINGSNGFIYQLLNNTSINGLQLKVLTNGNPITSAAPEPSALAVWALVGLGGGGLVIAARRKKAGSAL